METYDWRQHRRERHIGSIEVTISIIEASAIKKINFTAEVVDVSRGGIGIISEVALESGYVRLGGKGVSRTGTVMWNRKLDEERYRVGIRFDHLFSSPVTSRCGFLTVGTMDAAISNLQLEPHTVHFYEK